MAYNEARREVRVTEHKMSDLFADLMLNLLDPILKCQPTTPTSAPVVYVECFQYKKFLPSHCESQQFSS